MAYGTYTIKILVFVSDEGAPPVPASLSVTVWASDAESAAHQVSSNLQRLVDEDYVTSRQLDDMVSELRDRIRGS